jgi:hypothetical protein
MTTTFRFTLNQPKCFLVLHLVQLNVFYSNMKLIFSIDYVQTRLISARRVIFMIFHFLFNKNMFTCHANLISIHITTTCLNYPSVFCGKISLILENNIYSSSIYLTLQEIYYKILLLICSFQGLLSTRPQFVPSMLIDSQPCPTKFVSR